MKTSANGLEFIKKEEGCKLTAYKLKGEKCYTIGIGHYGTDVQAGQTITMAKAMDWQQPVEQARLIRMYLKHCANSRENPLILDPRDKFIYGFN